MSSKRSELLEHLRTTVIPQISTAAGYNNTVKLVERGLKGYKALTDIAFPAIFIAETLENRGNLTHNQFRSSLMVNIVGYVKSATSASGIQIELDKLIEDVTKALEQDRKQGGRALWTQIARVYTDPGDIFPYGTFIMETEFTYAAEGINP